MNFQIEDRAFLPDKTDGTPVPNARQAYHLDVEINNRLLAVIEDFERDPDTYLPRFEAFASTLKGAWAATVLAVGARDLAVITQSRKRARHYVGQISDEQILEHFDSSFRIDYYRQELLKAACGINPPAYSGSRHNVLFKNALGFGKTLSSYQFFEPNEAEQPRDPMPEGMVDYYNSTPGINRHNKALKEATSNFSSAYFRVKSNVMQSDRLFALRFQFMWELVDAEARYGALNAKLTKPLEEYVCYWTKYRWHNNIEYKHKGAQATWLAKLRIDSLEESLQDNEALINNPGWSISALVKEAWDALQIFKIILESEARKAEVKTEADRQRQLKRDDKLAQRKQLAETPIEIPAVETAEGLWIDHRALIEGLKGRSNVTKTYGCSFIEIKDVVLETSKLRQWLTLVLQDPNTGKRMLKRKWGQDLWAHIGITLSDRQSPHNLHETEKNRSLYFLTQTGKMRITTTFYDQYEELEFTREPVLHHVKFDIVRAEIPEHRGVWTPEDINEYHPVLVKA